MRIKWKFTFVFRTGITISLLYTRKSFNFTFKLSTRNLFAKNRKHFQSKWYDFVNLIWNRFHIERLSWQNSPDNRKMISLLFKYWFYRNDTAEPMSIEIKSMTKNIFFLPLEMKIFVNSHIWYLCLFWSNISFLFSLRPNKKKVLFKRIESNPS